ncbi:putative ribonuclease H-like domain-containing protein [Tanacetum coccineum]
MGLKEERIDQTLFIKKQKGDILLEQVYIDDIIFGSTNKELCAGFEKLIKDKFQMSFMGELTFFLGLQPLVKDGDVDDVDISSYSKDITSLSNQENFRYLKGKPTLGLWSSKDFPFELVAYTDSDYARETQDRKSTTRGCQFLGNRLISWQYLLTKGFDAGRFQYLVSRAATNASSLEQSWTVVTSNSQSMATLNESTPWEIGSEVVVLRCQDTILGDVELKLAQVLDLEKSKDAQAKEIAALKKRVQRLERKKKSKTIGLKRLKKDHDLMFDIRVLDTDEMHAEAKIDEKDEQSTKLDDSTASEAVTIASVEAKPKVVTTAATTTTTTRPMARGVVVQEPSEFGTLQEAQPSITKDKGKCIMIEPEVPLKRKDQVALDEQMARDIQAKLDAKLIEEEKLARKQEEEANIALIESWENTQAMMKADRLLAERLQIREREELTNVEKGKLFMELKEKRTKHFAALKVQEKINIPPTKAQKRTQMSTYLKHMGRYTYKHLKGKSFDEIQKLFDKEIKRVNTFMAMGSEVQESNENKVKGSEETAKGSRKKMLGRKRAGKEQ